MKKLFLLILITLSFRADAQLAADIAAWRGIVATNFACSTFHCRTKTIEAAEADSLYGLLLRVEAAVSAAGDLQAVTDLGNSTTNDIFMGTGTTGTPNEGWFISPSGEVLSGWDGASETIGLRFTAGSSWLYMKDAGSGEFAKIKAGTLTAARTALMPNEGDGAGLDATLVLHTTADPLTVGSTAGAHTITGTAGVQVKSSTTLMANYGATVNGGFLLLRDVSSGFSNILRPGTLTSADTNYLPPVTGVLASRRDTIGDAVSDFPKLVTENYLSTWTGGGANIGNTDLTVSANRTLNVSKQTLTFDSTNNFVVKDTVAGIQLLNLNDVTNYATSLIYANSHSAINQIRLKCVDGFTNMIMSSGSTRSLSMSAGTAVYSMTQNATVCSLNLKAGSSDGPRLVIDSSSISVNVGHLGGVTGAPTIAAGTGAGTGPTLSIVSGSTDLSGVIDLLTGTTCATSSTVATITFASAYATAPLFVEVFGANNAAAALTVGKKVFVDHSTGVTTTTFIITSGGTPLSDATQYYFRFLVIQ